MRTIRRRYALEQEIGRGASGSVWTALDLELGRRVAIKLLRSDALENAPARERFESEARTIALLRSPHVVQVYDAGVDEGEPFIVMELLHGESLEARLSRHPQLPFEIVAQLVSEIAKGLRAVHRAAVVHRDLKPANIFLCREPDREVVKILDFGISALLGGTTAEKSALTFMGTPQYMSPEQYRGGVPEPPSDLWALGVVTYRMLIGRAPFDAASLPALQDLVEHATYRPASECRPELPSGIDAFFKRAFAPAPRDRFASASDLAAELASLKGSEHGKPIRALFVDDESDMEILLKQRFRREVKSGKYEILFADSGEAALEELRRRPDIDVVLTDLNMPGMHGLTLLERIPEVNPLVRVVVLSAYSDMANIRAAMNQGAFDFLGKPIDFGDLTRTIDKSAANTHLIRQELASREENDVLRALIGRGLADRLVTLVKAADRERYTSFEGTVVWVELPVPSDVFARANAAQLLELLNRRLDDIVP
ncbi:MAG TPA: protein kinase, partial [Polyangiaceae bacterium]|nr:protein kinase [Polyangiaceae bacterium]